jgi:hypothetical protein
MPAIARKPQSIFGSALTPVGNLGVWGSLKDGAAAYSNDPAVLQSAEFQNGLNGALIGNRSPAQEDLNGLFYLLTYQLAYLLQGGAPEYDPVTTYWRGQLARLIGTPFIAGSKTDNNTGHDPTADTNNWTTSPLSIPVQCLTVGAQNVPVDGAGHRIAFANETLDTWNCWDPATSIFTAPVKGNYFVSSEIQCDANGNDQARTEMAYWAIDTASLGVLASGGVSVPNPPGARWYPTLNGILRLNAGQQIEFQLQANSAPANAGALTVANGQLSIFKLP